ncbi:precorrin-2 dehydrogenase/sirohydrochlorin ferrochelatase family protein [Sphingomonas vulcanisoli]|nr:NAD(P)-dependent oxidoreductase [Sphingomonas vulcanisoli]
MHSLPLFLRIAGQPVILIGEGETGQAKRRLLERAGARIVGQQEDAKIAFVALAEPDAVAAELRARGLMINVADRPDLCDFTLPAIVDRDPVLVAIGTGGASAGLAAALRQRLEAILPPDLGRHVAAFAGLRASYADPAERRGAIAEMLGALLGAPAKAGALDQTRQGASSDAPAFAGARDRVEPVAITSPDPDELTLRAARLLGLADRIYHPADMPAVLLDRARADAARIIGPAPALPLPGLSVELQWRM